MSLVLGVKGPAVSGMLQAKYPFDPSYNLVTGWAWRFVQVDHSEANVEVDGPGIRVVS